MSNRVWLLCAVLAWGTPLGAMAQPSPSAPAVAPAEEAVSYLPYSEPHPLEGLNVWGALARSVVALGLVLGLLGAGVVALRRWLPGGLAGASAGPVRLLGRVALTPKQAVYFLHVPGRVLLVGSGGGQLTTLGEITDPEEVAQLLQAAPGLTTAPGAAFGGLLRRKLAEDLTPAAMSSGAAAPPTDAIRRQIANLRSLARSEAK